jgi:hypothetical protein
VTYPLGTTSPTNLPRTTPARIDILLISRIDLVARFHIGESEIAYNRSDPQNEHPQVELLPGIDVFLIPPDLRMLKNALNRVFRNIDVSRIMLELEFPTLEHVL